MCLTICQCHSSETPYADGFRHGWTKEYHKDDLGAYVEFYDYFGIPIAKKNEARIVIYTLSLKDFLKTETVNFYELPKEIRDCLIQSGFQVKDGKVIAPDAVDAGNEDR